MAEPNFHLDAIKRHALVTTYGGIELSPLAAAPKISADAEVNKSVIYENGGHEEVAALLVRNQAQIEIQTKNIDAALNLVSAFQTGTDLMASTNRKALTFTPVANGEKTLVFPAAVLQPELSYVPTMGGDHVATLIFKAVPDAQGQLFTYAAI